MILDTSPDAIGTSNPLDASNPPGYKGHVTRFNLSTPLQLIGIDSYSLFGFGSVGFDTTVRIYADGSGEVGGLLHETASEVSAIDFDGESNGTYPRHHTPFEFSLTAGTYWIGVTSSGDSVLSEFAQLLVDDMAPRMHQTAQMSGTTTNSLFPDRVGTFD